MDRVDRRQVLRYGLALASLWVLPGCGLIPESRPDAKIPRIGFMAPGPESVFAPRAAEFQEGLRELGYVEGQNIIVDYRYLTDGNLEGLVPVAADLVQSNVDIIVTAGNGARVARAATSTIPIVFAVVSDPVGTGLVASLANPGGNVTGITNFSEGLDSKRLELLKQTVPHVRKVVHLWHPTSPRSPIHVTAEALALELLTKEAQSVEEIDRGLSEAQTEGAEALIISPSPLFITYRHRIIELAARYRWPGMYTSPDDAEVGGLLAYGRSGPGDSFQRAALFVDRILKGAKPADLPVEQPTTFHFTVNLKTARALGLDVPDSVLGQATEIIQ